MGLGLEVCCSYERRTTDGALFCEVKDEGRKRSALPVCLECVERCGLVWEGDERGAKGSRGVCVCDRCVYNCQITLLEGSYWPFPFSFVIRRSKPEVCRVGGLRAEGG